ncbi:hypothetical protein [Streptomyces albireticuli]|uniref:Uncharacterized protein n=1 Tax=Streptomyces albireticuli TaxID=1940 RepID=A0A2A2DGH7_9ACTN|nr:hypothetical protein [Streptomyces albireticuli]MCD9141863.1 hypothetical protein [Streptomyces albireticuli]MCD9163193.1 hypothetical protein [Streptomyces albireticuli]MCD9190036.1 hypothetical protein [Streptomyces albireticuli]PAU50644.1 hypothetical protein CK936_01500 [Streptomyces albireticuli]
MIRGPLFAAGLTGAVLASVLLGGEAAAAGAGRHPGAHPDGPEAEAPHCSDSRRIGFLFVDNSGADSWLEVDRTANTVAAGKGTAGSDHDGGGGAIDVHNRDVTGTGNSPAQSRESDDGGQE